MASTDTQSANDSEPPTDDEESQNHLRECLRTAARIVLTAVTARPHVCSFVSGVVVASGLASLTLLPTFLSTLLSISLRRTVQGFYCERLERTGRPGRPMAPRVGLGESIK